MKPKLPNMKHFLVRRACQIFHEKRFKIYFFVNVLAILELIIALSEIFLVKSILLSLENKNH